MNIVRRVVEILVDRFVASVGSLFAARIETLAALEHAEQQDELEERARRFEDEGKPHLAAKVRSRAADILTESPGAAGHNVLCQLQQEQDQMDRPRIAQTPLADDGPADPTQTPETKNRRPAKRRCGRRPKSD
jgi:hypothetical protein